MKKEISYNTKKRSEILAFINNNKDKHINADDISDFFLSKKETINKSTIYRYLKVLTNEGVIKKYVIDEKEGACYQCDDHEKECHSSLHLKCVSCNKLFHIDGTDYLKINKKIEKENGFIIDAAKTVLYGTCINCRGKNA